MNIFLAEKRGLWRTSAFRFMLVLLKITAPMRLVFFLFEFKVVLEVPQKSIDVSNKNRTTHVYKTYSLHFRGTVFDL